MVVAKDEIGEILAPYRGEREELIPILQDIQKRRGYLPSEAMARSPRIGSLGELISESA